jgi:hypothetical protein
MRVKFLLFGKESLSDENNSFSFIEAHIFISLNIFIASNACKCYTNDKYITTANGLSIY